MNKQKVGHRVIGDFLTVQKPGFKRRSKWTESVKRADRHASEQERTVVPNQVISGLTDKEHGQHQDYTGYPLNPTVLTVAVCKPHPNCMQKDGYNHRISGISVDTANDRAEGNVVGDVINRSPRVDQLFRAVRVVDSRNVIG